MDLLAKWNQKTKEEFSLAARSQDLPLAELVKLLLEEHLALWWSSKRTLPQFRATYLPKDQVASEKQLEKMADGLAHELKHMPQSPEERQAWQERLRPGLVDFARGALNLEQHHLDFIESTGMLEANLSFARMARQFDPKISAADIYQAGRNIMTANFLQLLLGLPVVVTPSVFAYSMLYPYTDNYLDDPAISSTTKLAFNHRFRLRLSGEAVRPANEHEAAINQLIEMIESQWDRARYPKVYESLLAIHAAQARSLGLVAPGASPFELDVLGISFEKGGTSVLADGYLVAGWLSAEQARFCFGYGSFTQLMDDLEDIRDDIHEGRASVFSQTARHWPLDAVTNQLFYFGRAIFKDLGPFQSPAVEPLTDLVTRGIDPVLIDTIGRAGSFYSKDYQREMERHLPFRFARLRQVREKLARQKIDEGKLIEAML